MPVKNNIVLDQRIIITLMFGRITQDDVTGLYTALIADPKFDPSFDHLVDLSGVEEIAVTSDIVRSLARRELAYHTKSRCALVAPQDVTFGMARMYISVRDHRREYRVFRERAEAESWLALPKIAHNKESA